MRLSQISHWIPTGDNVVEDFLGDCRVHDIRTELRLLEKSERSKRVYRVSGRVSF